MEENIPAITIRYSPIMDRYGKVLSQGAWQEQYKKFFGDAEYPSEISLIEKVDEYQNAWKEHESDILNGVTRLLGLNFAEKEIVVYVIGFGRAHSDPLVIPSNFKPQEAVGIISHELLHRLLTHNMERLNEDIVSPQLFTGETSGVAIHVVIHAILEHIYRDILGSEELLAWDIAKSNGDYKRAWDLVAELGYKNVIEKIRGRV
jgi:hypothetical protein